MARRLLKELPRAYGFDEVAIVPGAVTINPEMTSTPDEHRAAFV